MKKNALIIICVSILCLFAENATCQNNEPPVKQNVRATTATTKKDTLIVDTTGEDSVDTKDYTSFRLWDTTMERYRDSYIDTFSEDGVKFRIVHEANDTAIAFAWLEKYTAGKWIMRIEFDHMNHTGEFDRLDDVNRDGYKDITRRLRFVKEVYFFDPVMKDFICPASAELNYGIFMLDAKNNIFCDIQEYKMMAWQLHSTLYTFRGFTKYVFYDLDLDNHDNENHDLVTKLILSSCYGGADYKLRKVIEVIPLKKPVNIFEDVKKYPDGTTYYIDYRKFWKDRYRKLLGYK